MTPIILPAEVDFSGTWNNFLVQSRFGIPAQVIGWVSLVAFIAIFIKTRKSESKPPTWRRILPIATVLTFPGVLAPAMMIIVDQYLNWGTCIMGEPRTDAAAIQRPCPRLIISMAVLAFLMVVSVPVLIHAKKPLCKSPTDDAESPSPATHQPNEA